MHKLDLHTHSYASPDGSLQATDYKHMLESGGLDVIAVTDHNRIDFALKLQAELGERIIVGEEITTLEGEIIGLYLRETVPPHLSAVATVAHIREQGGLVYIPHPFETVRKGLTAASLDAIAAEVDIMETCNGRALQKRGPRAEQWAAARDVPGAASSDAHGKRGWGNTYSIVTETPTRKNLVHLLRSATYSTKPVSAIGRLYPKLNRLRKHS